MAALAATAVAACGTAPPPAQQIESRQTTVPVATLEACLVERLGAMTIAGIAPVTMRSRRDGRVRFEQWFITPATHQRMVTELAPAAAGGTEVAVYLLQQDARQYRSGGFKAAAVAAVDACVATLAR
jgi:hypothetical protein